MGIGGTRARQLVCMALLPFPSCLSTFIIRRTCMQRLLSHNNPSEFYHIAIQANLTLSHNNPSEFHHIAIQANLVLSHNNPNEFIGKSTFVWIVFIFFLFFIFQGLLFRGRPQSQYDDGRHGSFSEIIADMEVLGIR